MGNIKTPAITPLRTKGGTFYSFNSAIEDIGLNVVEKNNKVALSHYALLNIPMCNELPDSIDKTVNRFNIFSMPGAAFDIRENKDYQDAINQQNINQQIAQSFMSYALNMESMVVDDKSYDYTMSLTAAERIFWKWLKETGAIRWYKDENGYIHEGDNIESNYTKVVQGIGKIDGVANRSSDYGMYNEIYVNIPSSFGSVNVVFNEVEDNNYRYGKKFITDTYNLAGHNNDRDLYGGLLNVAFYDYTNETAKKEKKSWSTDIGGSNISDDNTNMYIVNNKPDKSNENTLITINPSDEIDYKFLRSNYDCLMIDINLDSNFYNIDDTYDKLAFDGENYYFNTILLYYSIYDKNNNILATNLYGVYFIESPEDLLRIENSDIANKEITTISFKLPSLYKMKSDEKGFGTSYAFRLNMRTSSIYDSPNISIYDNSSSENSIIGDFNNVVANLNKTINLLNKHVKNTYMLTNKITELENINQILQNKLIAQDKLINNILSSEKINEYENINTKSLNINNFNIKSDNGTLNINDIINIGDDISINNNINLNNLKILYDYSNDNVSYNVDDFDKIVNNIIDSVEGVKESDNSTSLILRKNNNISDDSTVDVISLIAAILHKVKKI